MHNVLKGVAERAKSKISAADLEVARLKTQLDESELETADRDAHIIDLRTKLSDLRKTHKTIKTSYEQVVNQLTASPSVAKPSEGLTSLKEGNVRNLPEKTRLQIQREAAGPAIPGRPLLAQPDLTEGPDGGNPAVKARQYEISSCQKEVQRLIQAAAETELTFVSTPGELKVVESTRRSVAPAVGATENTKRYSLSSASRDGVVSGGNPASRPIRPRSSSPGIRTESPGRPAARERRGRETNRRQGDEDEEEDWDWNDEWNENYFPGESEDEEDEEYEFEMSLTSVLNGVEKEMSIEFEVEGDEVASRKFDLIYKGQELSSGGQRQHDLDTLEEWMERQDVDKSNFKFYLEAFKFGMPPHGGYGLGIDRMIQKIAEVDNIKEAILFPRDPDRLTP